MFGNFNSAELEVVIADKVSAYQAEAELERHLPRQALRRRLAHLLRAWAEALEATPDLENRQLRGA
ncbi:hypothetical protein [Meiothermus sp.]|uniref:hypothetical protein n=1 Tax=Meiothermus sp. TaxID=1955249 RepID=UPI0021DCABBC|nr:hypothetical protein [Meiothermus sp.]GIW32900.1 MAG: hypothetical protein KatS3mg072_0233 [Meiothermus sp.]